MTQRPILIPVLLLIAFARAAAQQAAPARSDAEIEAFLKTARVVSSRPIGKGVTGSVRATMSDGTLTHDAQIQNVDEYRQEFRGGTQVERDFRDKWQFNVAAYRIDRMIGLGLAPVSVERAWQGRNGAFTWWIDDVMMDEGTRQKKQLEAPDTLCWSEQIYAMRVFDQLIDNADRNLGNTLIGKNWRLWAIDHTRAFRYNREPRNPAMLLRIDRALLARLKALEFAPLKKEVGAYLNDSDIRNLLARRDAIVAHFEKRGDQVLYDRRPPESGCGGSDRGQTGVRPGSDPVAHLISRHSSDHVAHLTRRHS